jgi:peptide deformylase
LSANQIGSSQRVMVMRYDNAHPPICLVNPRITKKKGTQLDREACLSMPNEITWVRRPMQVKVDGKNQYGVWVKYDFHGHAARVCCHEVDHLNGWLMTDPEGEKLPL